MMKVILYLAITVNGMIAKEDDNTDFTSKEDWDSFKSLAERTGNMIIGRRTYEVYNEDQFQKDVLYLVMTGKESKQPEKDNVKFITGGPKKALKYLADLNFAAALVAGGGTTNTRFISEGLVDDIYLDVEPVIISKGIPLFRPLTDFETKLELLETKTLSKQTVQLHYRVLH
jgi:dihydrofolate reductase